MRLGAIVWNSVRALLVLLCCYQLASALVDVMQANRMLQGVDASKPYGQVHRDLDPASVAGVLQRRGGDGAWGWLAGLGLLALLPYAPASKRSGSEQESPSKAR